jgi:hypothetical protein
MKDVCLRGKKEGWGVKGDITKLVKGIHFFFWYLRAAFKILVT